MGNKNFQKIVSSLIIVSLAFMIPYFRFAQEAQAQGVSQYFSGGISNAMLHLPLCNKGLVNNMKTLFSGGGVGGDGDLDPTTPSEATFDDSVPDALDPTTPDEATFDDSTSDVTGSSTSDLKTINQVSSIKASSIQVQDSQSIQLQKGIQTNNSAMKKKLDDLAANDTCLKSIGRLIIRMLIQKLTLSTVNWINGGFDGEPKFISDPGKYFSDIGKTEILGIGNELNNPTDYPFAKKFLQDEALSFKQKFADNAKYSFDKMTVDSHTQRLSTQEFQANFASGGWNAWDAMIQNEANNPMGFAVLAQNELAKRIQDKTGIAKESLQMSGGYLGVQKCTDPVGVTKAEDNQAKRMGITSGNSALLASLDDGTGKNSPRLCKNWVTVTPGKMVADAATKTMNYQSDALLNAQDLNDAIAAIMDSVLNHFASKIQVDGFTSLSSSPEMLSGSEGQYVSNPDYMVDYNSSQVVKDFTDFQINGSTFLATHPNFNIRTDLNQGLIDEQRIFVDKVARENRELKYNDSSVFPSKDNNWFTGNYGLIPTIYQLDYCIPGPHPGFEQDSQNVFNAVLASINPEDTNSVKEKKSEELSGAVSQTLSLASLAASVAIGAAIGTALPVLGTVVGAAVGLVLSYLTTWITSLIYDTAENRVKSYYAGIYMSLTGDKILSENDSNGHGVKSPALYSYGAFTDAMNTILSRYFDIVHDVYNIQNMPAVTAEANTKYLQIRGYNEMYKSNENTIISMNSTISRLVEIKSRIDQLKKDLESGAIDQDAYETKIKEWASAFSRISASMVSGDDIAKADKLIKQIMDEKDYVYKNLLKGPFGCEQELAKGDLAFPPQVYEIRRMSYPGPILYDYNNFGIDEKLPDPFGAGPDYENNVLMTSDVWAKLQTQAGQQLDWQRYGPGFLSLVHWESDGTRINTWCGPDFPKTKINNKTVPPHGDMHVALCFRDMFEADPWNATIGQSGGEAGTGIFETVIGIF